MNRSAVSVAAATACRLWVRVYTWRVPAELAERRRDEIESDLFEHADEARRAGVGEPRIGAEVLGRVLVGAPADLSWRRATRQRPHTRLALGGMSMSLSETNANRLLNILGGLVIFFPWFVTVLSVLLADPGESDVSLVWMILWLAIPLASTLVVAAGLAMRSRQPRRAMWLIALGALGPGAWFWFLPIYGPLMIATIAVAVMVTPRKPPVAALT